MKIFILIGKLIWSTALILSCLCLFFVNYKAHQPMSNSDEPTGMTFIEFIQDRLDAAKTIQPSQYGWGMMLSLSTLGPIYSVIYTEIAIHPNGAFAKVTAPDSDIPKGVAGANWAEIPDIWWGVVERLSWSMLGEPTSVGCQFRPIINNK